MLWCCHHRICSSAANPLQPHLTPAEKHLHSAVNINSFKSQPGEQREVWNPRSFDQTGFPKNSTSCALLGYCHVQTLWSPCEHQYSSTKKGQSKCYFDERPFGHPEITIRLNPPGVKRFVLLSCCSTCALVLVSCSWHSEERRPPV